MGRKLCVIWQSLTVPQYRSFFLHLAADDCVETLTLASPRRALELGGQRISAEKYLNGVQKLNEKVYLWTLWGFFPHPQIWIPFGTFALFLKKHDLLILMVEPYSLTFLWLRFVLLFTPNRNTPFGFYTAQNIRKRFPFLLRRIEKYAYKRAAFALCTGREQIEILEERGYQRKSILFPLWFDESVFHLRLIEKKRVFTFGFAGLISEEKGILDFLRTVEILKSGNFVFETFLVGAGPLESLVQEVCARMNNQFGTFIHFLGPKPLKEMGTFFSTLDLLVVPSKTTPHWKEQFGRVIVEAMACGTEVIGSNSGEIPNVLGFEHAIFDEGNCDQMAKLITQKIDLLNACSLQEANSKRTQISAESFQKYSSKRLAQNFLQSLDLLKKKDLHLEGES
jgi:L-malate glycosyltransferase